VCGLSRRWEIQGDCEQKTVFYTKKVGKKKGHIRGKRKLPMFENGEEKRRPRHGMI